MKNNGNPNQWEDRYPEASTVENDIKQEFPMYAWKMGNCWNICILYRRRSYLPCGSKNGEWHSDREPYGVIHRVASNGVTKGVTRAAFSYGLERSGYVRIDTHEDNKPMQGALKKFGFRECGVIHLERGAERIAFDCRKEWL